MFWPVLANLGYHQSQLHHVYGRMSYFAQEIKILLHRKSLTNCSTFINFTLSHKLRSLEQFPNLGFFWIARKTIFEENFLNLVEIQNSELFLRFLIYRDVPYRIEVVSHLPIAKLSKFSEIQSLSNLKSGESGILEEPILEASLEYMNLF